MNFRLLHIVILTLLGISNITLFSQQEGPEYFVENISIPGGAITDGINPEDIIFADNKYFVAGLGTVLVLDANFNTLNTISLSERGQYGYEASSILANNPTHCLMAFNGNNKLFVISPENEICIINTTGNGMLETQRIAKPYNVPSILFTKSIIRYDSFNHRLYWLITWDVNQIGYSYLGCYSAIDPPYESLWPETIFTTNQIMDIVISDVRTNDNHSYFYLARQSTIEVVKSDVGSYDSDKTIASGGDRKRLLYIHSGTLHRIYCISSTYVNWIDGNDYQIENSFPAPFSALNCLTYNPENDELFLGGNLYAYIYQASNPQGVTPVLLSENNNDGPIYRMECFDNNIYASLPDKLILINGSDHSVVPLLSKQNNFFGSGAYNPDPVNKGVVITNMEGASLEIFNSQGHANALSGVSVYRSCYNLDNGKFYFYSDELRDDSKIVIIQHDLTDNLYNLDEIISYNLNGTEVNISSCCYNESANHLLISSYSESHQIKKIHGNNNEDAGSFSLANGFCENVFITPQPNSEIYCATAMNSLSDASIEIFDADSYSSIDIIDGLGSGYESYEFRTDFCYNSKDNDVYLILFRRSIGGTSFGKLIKIDPDNNYSMNSWDLDGNPEKILYTDISNKIYIKYTQEEYITEFDCNNLSNPLTNRNFNYLVKDIDYGKFFNRLYVLTASDNSNNFDRIYQIYCAQSDFELRSWWEVPIYSYSIKFDEFNQRVYTYAPYKNGDLHKAIISAIDEYKVYLKELYLYNSQSVRYSDPLFFNELIIDPSNGYLLIPNGSHSNISVIRCPERLALTGDINWISFPRLDRNPQNDEEINSVEALTNRIIPGPDKTFTGHMYHLEYDQENPQIGDLTAIDKISYTSPWDQSNELLEVYSNRGYQLQVTPDQKSIYFYGQIQNPAVPVNLHGTSTDRFCNWVGYYLTYPQSPFEAIPANILNNLRFMAGQYWSCVFNDPVPDNPGPGCWRCAINQGRLEINYGDMVKLTSISNNSFTWQQNDPEEPSIEKLKAESFTYTEQYNYDTLFIELDTTNLPSEIGAFAGDSCVGATKVLPGDTTVLICAYTEGYEGDEITFELSYDTKSSRPERPDYFVKNPNTGKSERRRIIVGETQTYHFVSFKSHIDNPINTLSTKLDCYPNPANDAFSVSYYIPEDSYVKLEILNPLGIEVLEKPLGYQMQGNHSVDIQTVGLPIGYYFVRIYTSDQLYIGTLLVNH